MQCLACLLKIRDEEPDDSFIVLAQADGSIRESIWGSYITFAGKN